MNIAQTSIIATVHLYQKILSPDHSFWARGLDHTPYCRHIPSCSDYMIEAVESRGAIIGVAKGIARIGRCNPWNAGGYDPVENRVISSEVKQREKSTK